MIKKDKLIPVLYLLLADELTDLESDLVSSETCENLGSAKLEQATRKPTLNEMQNVGWLIERIIFFEGSLKVSNTDVRMISKSVSDTVCNIRGSETLNSYYQTEKLTCEDNDPETTDLLNRIHDLQNDHADWYGMALFT